MRVISATILLLLYIALTSSVFLYKLPMRGGMVAHTPDSNSPPPPPNTDGQLGVRGWEMRTVRVRGMGYHAPTPQAGRVTDSDGGGGGEELGLGGRWYHAPMLLGSGEVKLYRDYEVFKQWQ